jgi:ribosome-associated protein
LSGTPPELSSRVRAAADAAADKHGTDVAVLAVGGIIAIIDWFVLVSASNTRLARTIVEEVQRALRSLDDSKPIGVEGLDDARWVLLDYGDVVIHVFVDETRAYYDLDRLWADAPRVDWDAAPAPAAAEGS